MSAECDLILVLAHHFPEVGVLRKNARNGTIAVAALGEAVIPYRSGRKPLPVVDPKAE